MGMAFWILVHCLWLGFAGLQAIWLWKSRPVARQWVLPVALVGGSLLLRWFLFPGGPGDLRLNLSDAFWSVGPSNWGVAPPVFFKMLGLGASFSQLGISMMFVNSVLASLLPLLFYLLLKELGFSTRNALPAAIVTSLFPILLLFSKVLNRQPIFLFLAFTSLYHGAGYLRRMDHLRLALVVISISLAVLSRPEGGGILVCHAALVGLVPGLKKAREILMAVVALLGLMSFFYLLELPSAFGFWAGQERSWLLDLLYIFPSLAIITPSMMPLAHVVFWIAGLLAAPAARRRLALCAVATIAGLVTIWVMTPIASHIIGFKLQLASSRYQSILSFPVLLGTALAVERLDLFPWRYKGWIVGLGLALYVGTYVLPFQAVILPHQIDYEYNFVATESVKLPEEAEIYYLEPPANDLGFVDLPDVSYYVGRQDLRWSSIGREELDSLFSRGDSSNTYYYAGSMCSRVIPNEGRWLDVERYEDWLQACEEIRNRCNTGEGSVVARLEIPARAFAWYQYADPTIELFIARISKGQ